MKEIQIKAGNFPIYISLDVLIPAVIFSILGEPRLFFLAFLFSVMHEFAHLAVVRLLKYNPERITINMYGEVLHLKNQKILPEHQLLINLSGPTFNLLVALALFLYAAESGGGILGEMGLWEENVVQEIIIINTTLGIFNLLPFYPLDGGKIVFVYLSFFLGAETGQKIIFVFAKIFLIFNFILGIYLVQYNLLNLLICLLSGSLLLSVIKDENSRIYRSVMKAKKEQEKGKYV